MPDPSSQLKMCINVMTSSWSRVRHWSAPERLQWTEADTSSQSSSSSLATGDLRNALANCKSSIKDSDDNDLVKMTPETTDCQKNLESIIDPYPDDDPFELDVFHGDEDLSVVPDCDERDQLQREDNRLEEMTLEQMEKSWLKLWSASVDKDPDILDPDPRPKSKKSVEKSIYLNVIERLDNNKEQMCSNSNRSSDHHNLLNSTKFSKSVENICSACYRSSASSSRQSLSDANPDVPEPVGVVIAQQDSLPSMSAASDLGYKRVDRFSPSNWSFLSWISSSLISPFSARVSEQQHVLQQQQQQLLTCTTTTSTTCPTQATAATSSSFRKPSRIKSCTKSNPFLWLLITSILLIATPPASARICKTAIIYDLKQMEKALRGCTVIEGHLAFTNMLVVPTELNETNTSFPELREITDFLLLYLGDQIKTLATIFPNLSVIRGNRLIKDFALVIREMKGMEEIGLSSLTHILRGGVRIEKNSDLCYVDTVNWEAIVTKKYHSLIAIDQNEFSNKNCMNKCPTVCGDNNYCWNEKSCQTVKVPCPHGSPNNLVCYRNGTSVNGQMVFQCDKECLGGCHGGQTQDNCFACANARLIGSEGGSEGGCRNTCPEPSLLYDNWRCITAKQCSAMSYSYNAETIDQRKFYKSFEGQCIAACPEDTNEEQTKDGLWICKKCVNCPLECQGAVISSLEDLYRFKGCTQITGDLTIQIRGENVVEELQRHLSRVKTITGSLKIARSFPIVSLDFFQNLEEIQGIHPEDSKDKKHYSITIMENENLQKLFPLRPNGKPVKIKTRNGVNGQSNKGKAFIHYNPKLCPQEIKSLLKNSELEDPGINSAEISYATNGDKAVCSSNKLNLTVFFGDESDLFSGMMQPRPKEIRQQSMTVQFNNYQEEIMKKNPTNNVRALLGYEIHYRVIDKGTYEARNLTKYGGRDACGGDEWHVIDHPPTDQEQDKTNLMAVWPPEVDFIHVRPYTYYAIFVTTLIVREVTGSAGIDGAQSDIFYVLSPEDFPSPPHGLTFNKFNYSTINLTWSPPESPNGIIDHYELTMDLKEPNLEKLRDVDYCDEDYRKRQSSAFPPVTDKQTKQPTTNTSTDQCPCDCRTCGKPTKKNDNINAIERQFIDHSLVDQIIDTFFTQQNLNGPNNEEPPRSKRSITTSKDNHVDKNDVDNEKSDESSTSNPHGIVEIKDDEIRYNVTTPTHAENVKRPYSKKQMGIEHKDDVYVVYSKQIPGNIQHDVVKDLQHDSTYVIKLRACHRHLANGVKRCSEYAVQEFKTLTKPEADNIPGGLHAHHDSSTNGANNASLPIAFISWEPPKNPNTMIVSYNVKFTKVDDEKYIVTNCITAKAFEDNRNRYIMKLTGTYNVEVQAVPLYAEPGKWTSPVKINVAVEGSTQLLLALLIPILLVIGILGGIGAFFYVKSKNGPAPLIDNEQYPLWENVFSKDEYWIERDLVEVGELIGSGAFGEVYQGSYKHPNGQVKVAIKMLRETASWVERKLFLEEANIMKNLRSAHIVELVGAVPNGFPSYILLEMMPNGDLKKYLRDSRPLHLNRQAVRAPPTERELLQMALEIADGMAYLSSRPRSIVHRDLAARNCLLTAGNVVKVGDFGRARDVYESEYYRQTFRGMVPVRWMPPESLRDGEYVTKSDVWSYGVVMWEMATLAEEPYQGMPHDEVVRVIIYENGKPEIRQEFPNSLKEVMEMCWKRYPDDRPSFVDICKHLESHANERFRNTAFVFSDEGQKFINASNEDDIELNDNERAPLRGSSSSGCGNGNTGNSNGDARSASTTDNGHAVMAASAASELNSVQSHAGEVRQLGPSGSVSLRNSASASNNLSSLRNIWLRLRNGGRIARGNQPDSAVEA